MFIPFCSEIRENSEKLRTKLIPFLSENGKNSLKSSNKFTPFWSQIRKNTKKLCNTKRTPVRACFYMISRRQVVPPGNSGAKGRKQNHFGFWNISPRSTSVASLIEIG